MAVNNNGNLLDSAGNVAVDFVWGNFPLQPNDQRPDTNRLDFALDNHVIAQVGWNGYPQYVGNTDGSAVDSDSPADGIQADEIFLNISLNTAVTGTVPLVIGQTTALAVDSLKDEGFATVTTGTAATNAAKSITAIARTAGNAEVSITAVGAVAAYPVGAKIAIGASTGIPTELVGTWTVTGNSSTNVVKFTSNGTTVLSVASGALTGSASLTGVAGTVKSITLGAGTLANQTTASTVTVTPYDVAS